jgi:5,5'-dehydrodivanillate O-demethylase
MLSQEQNDRLTQVGPGTPMGTLMRRYWHPIAGSAQLTEENPTREVRILGEDLVLFRSAVGKLGLIEPSCPHRKANLSYGVPEPEGIRCAYHGWLFDEQGNCVDQPSEPAGSRFKEKVHLRAYPVEELGGLIFAYMGPDPVPLLPHWDILEWEGVRVAWSCLLPCSWLQCQENSLDPLHFQWLHRYWGGWEMNRLMPKEDRDRFNRATASRGAEHKKVGFELTDYGVIKRRIVGDETEDDDHWRVGHPVLFPNILRVVDNLQFRVPVDDTHTLHMRLEFRHLEPGETTPAEVPFEEKPLYDEMGRLKRNYVAGQDQTAWVIQGPISDRTTEHLGISDVGIIMYRKLLMDQMRVVQDGGEPINIWRDTEKAKLVVLPVEYWDYPGYEKDSGPFDGIVPRTPDVEADLSGKGEERPEFVSSGTYRPGDSRYRS